MKTKKLLFAFGLLLSATVNTLCAQLTFAMESLGNDGIVRKFNHPYLMIWGNCLAQAFCLIVFVTDRTRRTVMRKRQEALGLFIANDDPVLDPKLFNPLIFCPPALLELAAGCMVSSGLCLTHVGSFQMLRGCVIIFTALLARFLLHKHIKCIQWFGIFVVMSGIVTVGVTDILYVNRDITFASSEHFDANDSQTSASYDPPTFNEVLMGDLLIIGAQIIVAFQVIYEQYFITKYDVHVLHVLGLEGLFGCAFMSCVLVAMYWVPVGPKFGTNSRQSLEDALDGFFHLKNPYTALAFTATIGTRSIYGFIAIWITKIMGSTTRVVIDSIRVISLWLISMGLSTVKFSPYHLLGFTLWTMGIFIYNEIILVPGLKLAWNSRWNCMKKWFRARPEDPNTTVTEGQFHLTDPPNKAPEPSTSSQLYFEAY